MIFNKDQRLSDLPGTLPRVLVRLDFHTYNKIYLSHCHQHMAVWVVASKENFTESVYNE